MQFERPWVLLLLIPLLVSAARPVLLAAWRLRPSGAAAPPRQSYGLLRALVVLLLTLALAGTQLVYRAPHQAVIIVADISASTLPLRASQEEYVRRALAAKAAEDVAGVVAVAQEAQVEVPPSRAPQFSRFGAVVAPDHTDLERGLRLATAVLPTGYRPRILLLSDGRENQGNLMAQIARLRRDGVTVDVVPLTVAQGPEALVQALVAPAHLRTGADLSVQVTVSAGAPTTGVLRFYDERRLVETRPVELPAGQRTFEFRTPEPAPGHHRLRVSLEAGRDTLAQNNEAGALVQVQGPPEVLVLEAVPRAGTNIVGALRSTGVQVTVQPAASAPQHAAALARYGAVVLADVPAAALGAATIKAISTYVREGGGGLLALGGQHSYSMGGYAGTPLEQILPVRMEVPQHREVPAVALVLLIENLEGDWKTDIGKEAGKAVVNLLGPSDLVAVNDITAGWAVPLQPVTDKEKILQAIDAINPGDPPHYILYLEDAHAVLKAADAKVKHIIAMFDGDAQAASMAEYYRAVAALAADGITLSTIHVNPLSPEEFTLLQAMAQWGGGRYYLGDNFNNVPEIILKEAQTTARTAVVEMDFNPTAVGRHPLLRGLAEFPILHGYLGTTAKPTAQVVLQSPHGDPILAAWQIGLGRAVAWTTDSQGLWTTDFLRWSGANTFLSNLVGWTLTAAGEDLQVRSRIQGSVAHLQATLGPGALTALNQGTATTEWPPSLAVVALRPDGTPAVHTLLATGPGRYEGDVPVPQVGPYTLLVSAVRGRESVRLGTAGLLVPYSPEFTAAGTDEPLLRLAAAAGGGKVAALDNPRAAFARDLPPAPGALPLAQWLLAAAALLWPLDIAARRLALRAADVPAGLAALRHWLTRRHQPDTTASGLRQWAEQRRAVATPRIAATPHGTAAGGSPGPPAPPTAPGPQAPSVPSGTAAAADSASPAPAGGSAGAGLFTEHLLASRKKGRKP